MNKHLKIRQVKEDDAEEFVNLQEDLEQSGFMLHEPGEKTAQLKVNASV